MQFVIVGLGNMGEKYARTRHNAGRLALIEWVRIAGGHFVASKKYHGDIWETVRGEHTLVALLPQTYMNESGGAVRTLIKSKKAAETLVVLYDDIDLPLGTVRVSFNRGSGGHNGIKSIVEAVHTEGFIRIRIGIAPLVRGSIKKPKGEDAVVRFVLSDFKKQEEEVLQAVYARVGEIIETILVDGREVAMNRFNGL